MNTDQFVCDMGDKIAQEITKEGPCEGSLYRLRNNSGRVLRCERHVKMVQALLKRGQSYFPLWQFLRGLDDAGRERFEREMAAVEIDKLSWEIATRKPREIERTAK